MPTKVLVFESDSSFAGELRTELGRLGCTAQIVDDGNAGLSAAAADRPDLILLSIELPRMNGFSVCNKLKKDPALKDVPLIIMSSESSDETFEQHRKLRTRAEDYVHKPIAFGELLEHITRYVPLAESNGPVSGNDDSAILIDDEIALDDVVSLDEPMAGSSRSRRESNRPRSRPAPASQSRSVPPPSSRVDAEVDAFAESAFGRLLDDMSGSLGGDATAKGFAHEGAPASSTAARGGSFAGVVDSGGPARIPSIHPPSIASADAAELEQVRAELARQKSEVVRLEREVTSARAEAQRLEDELQKDAHGDVQRMQRELDELRARGTAPTKASGVSSREFLDLREGLNRKDKEILALREQISRKEKDLLDASDGALALEREKADLEDRIGALEKEVTDARAAAQNARADQEQAAKRAQEFQARADKAKQDLETALADLNALRRKHDEEIAARDAELARTSADHQRATEEAAEQRRAAVEAAEETGRQNVVAAMAETRGVAQQATEEALAKVLAEADVAKAAAIAAREVELSGEHEARLVVFERANHEEQARLKQEITKAEIDSANARADLTVRDRELAQARAVQDELRAELESRQGELQEQLATTRERLSTLEREKSQSEEQHEARHASRTAEIDARTAERDALVQDLGAVRDRASSLESELLAVQADLGDLRQRLASESERGTLAYAALEANRGSLERAKDALAAALAQIEEAEARGASS